MEVERLEVGFRCGGSLDVGVGCRRANDEFEEQMLQMEVVRLGSGVERPGSSSSRNGMFCSMLKKKTLNYVFGRAMATEGNELYTLADYRRGRTLKNDLWRITP